MLKKILMTMVSVIAITAPRVAHAACGGGGGDSSSSPAVPNLNAKPSNFSMLTDEELSNLRDFVNAMNKAGNSNLISNPAFSNLKKEISTRKDGGKSARRTSESATSRTKSSSRESATSRTTSTSLSATSAKPGFSTTGTATTTVADVGDKCTNVENIKDKKKKKKEAEKHRCDPELVKFNKSAVRKALKDSNIKKQIEKFGSPELKQMLRTALVNQAKTPATITQ